MTKPLIKRILNRLASTGPRRRLTLIADVDIAVGDFRKPPATYRTDIDKEDISREYLFRDDAASTGKRRFLDAGGRDGKLSYLLGHIAPLKFDRGMYQTNKARFDRAYDYFGLDLFPAGENVLAGDICDPAFLDKYERFSSSFDVIYSNNVFEHFARPWIAASVLYEMLKKGGLCITIVPFSQRYHESPGDYFRYTHEGVIKLFEAAGPIEVLEAGFDIRARRYDWQGTAEANDIVPMDRYGAWRETWFTVVIFRKT